MHAKLGWGATAFRYPPPVELIRPRLTRIAYDTIRRYDRDERLTSVARQLLRGTLKPRLLKAVQRAKASVGNTS